jgi:hypothetical protein
MAGRTVHNGAEKGFGRKGFGRQELDGWEPGRPADWRWPSGSGSAIANTANHALKSTRSG